MLVATSEEIQKYRKELANNSKALADLDIIERCEGNLEIAARILARREGLEEIREGSVWQLALQKAREIVCDNKFKETLVPGLIGGLIGTLTSSGSPILVAVATPISIYITQITIEEFCKSPKSGTKKEDNFS
jgi:hypothetical protein